MNIHIFPCATKLYTITMVFRATYIIIHCTRLHLVFIGNSWYSNKADVVGFFMFSQATSNWTIFFNKSSEFSLNRFYNFHVLSIFSVLFEISFFSFPMFLIFQCFFNVFSMYFDTCNWLKSIHANFYNHFIYFKLMISI